MTETEWLHCPDPFRMLRFLRAEPGCRKMHLLEAACFRRVWADLPQWARDRVDLLEAVADGNALADRLGRDLARLTELVMTLEDQSFRGAMLRMVLTADWRRETVVGWFGPTFDDSPELDYSALVRDLFGNPFGPLLDDPAWRTTTVVEIARGIEAKRAYNRMPILGDALEDAGCDRADVLLHCRGEGEHVRGCWLIDDLLERD